MSTPDHADQAANRVRLDKWLWAARFFKTRSLAKQAIDGGKIQIDGVRAKPGRDVVPGMTMIIRQGFDEKTVIVRGLSEVRRGAPEAARLYEETPDSRKRRELAAIQRKLQPPPLQSQGKPNKRDRRLLHRFKTETG